MAHEDLAVAHAAFRALDAAPRTSQDTARRTAPGNPPAGRGERPADVRQPGDW